MKQDDKEGEWHAAKGTQTWILSWGHCSEDKASTQGMPALPTELIDTLLQIILRIPV